MLRHLKTWLYTGLILLCGTLATAQGRSDLGFPAARSAAYLAGDAAAKVAIAAMEKDCRFEDEPPHKRQPGFKKAVALGHENWAFIISGEKLACNHSSMCGTGGCQLSIIAVIEGVAKPVFARQVREWKLINKAHAQPYLQLDLHGGNCGKTGAEACPKKLNLSTGEFI